MTGIRKFGTQISLAFLVCVLLFFDGCNRGGAKEPKELKRTPAEKNKARLLRKIDRKFENPDAHFELGKIYQADGLWSKAEYEYNTALAFNPVHRKAQAARVKVLMNGGDTAKAEILADIYMSQAASLAEGSLLLALAFQKEELDEYALGCYRQALRLAPNSANINRQIGYYYLSKADNLRAQDYLSRSFQLNPNQPEVAGQLGRLGVVVKRPRKTKRSTKKLEKIVEQADKERKP